MSERVEIELCIGLEGVCVIGIISDSDVVFDDVSSHGAETWYERLPEHDAPLEGIYRIVTDVTLNEDNVQYDIIETKKRSPTD